MVKTVLRSDMMRHVDQGKAINLVFVMCDRRRGVAGRVKRVKNWVKMKMEEPQQLLPGRYMRKTDIQRNVDHWKNKTFIIYNPVRKSDHPITVHYRLVLEYDGKRVING